MTKYRFKHWEDSTLTNPKRTFNLNKPTILTAYYEEVIETPRKGLPSESNVVTVTVHPQVAEPTTLVLASDKTEYISGEAIVLAGKLTFTSDNVSLPGRTIDIYKNTVKINSVVSGSDGGFKYVDTAENVAEDTNFDYQAKFAGEA